MKNKFFLKDVSYLDSSTMQLKVGSIKIVDGIISEIEDVIIDYGSDIIIEAQNIILMPGLVNAHLHPSKEIYGGALDASPIDIVLDTVHKNNALEDSEGQFIASLKSLTSGLMKGVTTYGVFTSRIQSDIRAIQQAGVRCVINYCQSNQWIGSGYSPENRAIDEIIQKYLEAEDQYQSELIKLSPATASELSANEELLLSLHSIANKRMTNFTLHIHEGRHQVESYKNFYGQSAISNFDKMKLLDKNTTLIHCCTLSEEDINILKRRDCNIVHCPVSNSFVGAGTMPIRPLWENRNIGLGTDAAMVNPNNDLTFDAIFSLYHHGDSDFENKINAAEVIYMLTEGGAKALGFKDIGKIEKGYKADFIFFNKDSIDVDYINTPVSLLKMLNREKPNIVMINGVEVVKNNKLVNFNLSENNVSFSMIRERLA
ncbi:amidohydrolase family protein [Xenorhabdus nematophila]|nr:amidohydrolase family protein [Xenorhabdus nematophila]CEK25078.1 conserved hypothetical protein [Xenorhabdus nematophila AN6/1]